MPPVDVFIGERGGDHLRIRVLSRTEQVMRDYWDENWLVTAVSVNVGGWKGKNEKAYFRTEELARFRAKVALIAEGKLLDAEFAPMEPHLRFRMQADEGGGLVSISGSAIDRLEDGNALTFRMSTPFATLSKLAAQLAEVERAYPTIGKA